MSYSYKPEDEKKKAVWKLDDGSPLPDQVKFTNTQYTKNDRTFIGTLIFEKTVGGGVASMDYTVVFSEDFLYVEGGQIVEKDVNGAIVRDN
jgi:hypothetical protein